MLITTEQKNLGMMINFPDESITGFITYIRTTPRCVHSEEVKRLLTEHFKDKPVTVIDAFAIEKSSPEWVTLLSSIPSIKTFPQVFMLYDLHGIQRKILVGDLDRFKHLCERRKALYTTRQQLPLGV